MGRATRLRGQMKTIAQCDFHSQRRARDLALTTPRTAKKQRLYIVMELRALHNPVLAKPPLTARPNNR
jgi:hypothetical protein